MALYIWKCQSCGDVTRRILPKRPVLDVCMSTVYKSYGYNVAGEVWADGPCCGKLAFITNTSQSTKEVIDNGLMYKPVERDPNIEAQLKERNELAEKVDDPLV